MRDERLRALDDPGEIANAELISLEQRRSDSEPSRIGKSTGKRRSVPCKGRLQTSLSEPLGNRKVEAKQVATIVSHDDILTIVGMNI